MFHLVARARPGNLLFRRWVEGRALWASLARAFPEQEASCLMPDHVHLVLPHADPGARLARVMSGYARWRNRHRRARGPVWATHPAPEAISDRDHLRRTVRYVHLNPCRARLVTDPLAWPFSTHRDRVGFAAPPVVAAVPDPPRFHQWVSADPTVALVGTALPTTRYEPATWAEVLEATAAVYRCPTHEVYARGPARVVAMQAAWVHGLRARAELAGLAGVDTVTVWRAVRGVPERGARVDGVLGAVVRAVGDPRFFDLHAADLATTAAWARYRGLR